MILRILHIDDEPETLKDVAKVVNGEKQGLWTSDRFCGNFDEGMKLLQDDDFDLIILDLTIGNAAKESDKVGEKILKWLRIVLYSVVFNWFAWIRSALGIGHSAVVGKKRLWRAFQTNWLRSGNKFLQLKGEINGLIRDGLSRISGTLSIQTKMIDEIQKDKVSFIFLFVGSEKFWRMLLQQAAQDEKGKDGFIHPYGILHISPLTGEFETGDILLCKKTGQYYVILTPLAIWS